METGKVIKSTGSWYDVKLEDGSVLPSRIRGKFRIEGLKITNPVAVGDIVKVNIIDGTGLIEEIMPRTNYVVRQSPRKKHQLHLLASNIDQALLIITITHPNLKQGFIDRFLLMTEPYNIPVHIIFNKSDLYGEQELNMYHYLKSIYQALGYNVYLISSTTGEGIDEIKEILKDKVTLISGQSGVGKSTMINAIDDSLEIKTQELSDYSGKGQHTTTFATMYDLDAGGSIIDTPGIKTLAFNHLEVMDVAHNFREMFATSSDCRFGDCTHRNEPHCAVKEAVEEGVISELRYMNYLTILEEIEDQNYWERRTDM